MVGSFTMSSETWPQAETEEPDPLPNRRGLLTGVFLAVIVIGFLVISASGEETVAVAEVGAKAPDFEVVLFDGTVFSLADHLEDDGRPMAINLWASWCAPCRFEIPALSLWAENNPDVYVIGVAVEDVDASARDLVAELEPNYDTGMGEEDFRSKYPSFGLPATYITDGDGRVTAIVNGIVTEQSLDELFAS